MPVNKARNRLEDRLVNEVAGLKEQQAQAKTPQQIGSDIIKVSIVPSGGYAVAGPVTVAGLSAVTFNLQITPADDTLTLWNFLHTIYVDANDSAHQFPNGASLTAAQANLAMAAWIDWADSNDITNMRVYKVRVTNLDSASHNYYIRVRAYLPLNPGVSA